MVGRSWRRMRRSSAEDLMFMIVPVTGEVRIRVEKGMLEPFSSGPGAQFVGCELCEEVPVAHQDQRAQWSASSMTWLETNRVVPLRRGPRIVPRIRAKDGIESDGRFVERSTQARPPTHTPTTLALVARRRDAAAAMPVGQAGSIDGVDGYCGSPDGRTSHRSTGRFE